MWPAVAYLELLLGDDAVADELVAVLFQDDRLTINLLVHDRLREHRLIVLIVTIASITNLWRVYTEPQHNTHMRWQFLVSIYLDSTASCVYIAYLFCTFIGACTKLPKTCSLYATV